jgi:ubiquinol-cytochrome c reductase cytochrome c1 subunit
MSPAEFDQAIYDLVNFMAYVGEPSRLQSERIGTYVLIFLAIFTFFAYLLKREYWRDIH